MRKLITFIILLPLLVSCNNEQKNRLNHPIQQLENEIRQNYMDVLQVDKELREASNSLDSKVALISHIKANINTANILADTAAVISPGMILEELFLSGKDVVLTLRFQDDKGLPVFIGCLEDTGVFSKIESFAKSPEESCDLHRYDVTYLYDNPEAQKALNPGDFSKLGPKYPRIKGFLQKYNAVMADSDLEALQRTAKSRMNRDIQRLKLLKKKLAEMREHLSKKKLILIRLLEILPHHPVDPSAREILQNLAGRSKIKFTQLQAGPIREQKYYSEQFYTLKFATHYESMLGLLQNIQKQKRLFHVNKLYFKPRGDLFTVGKLDVSLRLSTFFNNTFRKKGTVKNDSPNQEPGNRSGRCKTIK